MVALGFQEKPEARKDGGGFRASARYHSAYKICEVTILSYEFTYPRCNPLII